MKCPFCDKEKIDLRIKGHYERLLKKYKNAEKNLKNDPDRFGGEDYIKGCMCGLTDGMALLDDNLISVAEDMSEKQ